MTRATAPEPSTSMTVAQMARAVSSWLDGFTRELPADWDLAGPAAWAACEDPRAMLSLAAYGASRAAVVALCDGVRSTTRHVEPGDARSGVAIALAEAWARGAANLDGVRVAAAEAELATEEAGERSDDATDAYDDVADRDGARGAALAAAAARSVASWLAAKTAAAAARAAPLAEAVGRRKASVSSREGAAADAYREAIRELIDHLAATADDLEALQAQAAGQLTDGEWLASLYAVPRGAPAFTDARRTLAEVIRATCPCPTLEDLCGGLAPSDAERVPMGAVLVGVQPDPYCVSKAWAERWAPDGNLEPVWRAFPTASFHLLLLARLGDRHGVVRAACACARTLLEHAPAEEAQVVDQALTCAERWGEGHEEQVAVAAARARLEAHTTHGDARAAALNVLAIALDVQPAIHMGWADHACSAVADAHAAREMAEEGLDYEDDADADVERESRCERWHAQLGDIVRATVPCPKMPPVGP